VLFFKLVVVYNCHYPVAGVVDQLNVLPVTVEQGKTLNNHNSACQRASPTPEKDNDKEKKQNQTTTTTTTTTPKVTFF
jgi:hypothetical protein